MGDATPEVLRGAGDCVNDGAQANPLFGTQGKAACDSIPGLFIQVNAKIWECNYAEGNPPNFTYTASLNTACDLKTNGWDSWLCVGPERKCQRALRALGNRDASTAMSSGCERHGRESISGYSGVHVSGSRGFWHIA